MIRLASYNAFAPDRLGSAGPELQCTWRVSRSSAGSRLSITLRGGADEILDLSETSAAKPGATEIPNAAGAFESSADIICESAEVQGELGGIATLTLNYRERNERETDADCADGLLSRTVSTRWVERQEMIEHFMARVSEGFDGAAFAAWLAESDPAAKAGYRHAVESGDMVELEGDTLAAAQRYNMGVQYAALFMLQIEVSETWSKPVNTSAACNAIVDGIPAEHKPIFGVDSLDSKFSFMRAADQVQHLGGNLYHRTVTYLCLPDSFKPTTKPEGWGDGPFDGLLYGGNRN